MPIQTFTVKFNPENYQRFKEDHRGEWCVFSKRKIALFNATRLVVNRQGQMMDDRREFIIDKCPDEIPLRRGDKFTFINNGTAIAVNVKEKNVKVLGRSNLDNKDRTKECFYMKFDVALTLEPVGEVIQAIHCKDGNSTYVIRFCQHDTNRFSQIPHSGCVSYKTYDAVFRATPFHKLLEKGDRMRITLHSKTHKATLRKQESE